MMLLDKKTESIIRTYIPTADALGGMADFFSALSDPNRVKIISVLAMMPICVSDLAEILDINQTTLSHQLRTLKNLNIVKTERQGKIVFYSIKNPSILEIMLSASKSV